MRINSLFMACAVATAACTLGSSTSVDQSTDVATVTVSAPSTNIAVHSTTQLTATPKNAAGAAIIGLSATWASSNGSVASVDGTGKVTGVAPGNATITATISNVTGSLDVVVH
jgi:uncharacterized protein YjdB